MAKIVTQSKKVLIGIVGGLVTLAGVVLIPYPGPGWLIVFAGLAILATEFTFAERTLKYARDKYDRWVAWLQRQPWPIRIVSLALTGLVVVVTLWLFNAFGIAAALVGVDIDWVTSPFLR